MDMKLLKNAALFLGIFTILSVNAAAGQFIVKDGKPNAEIVIAEKPAGVIKLAAEQLQLHIKEMTGAELPVVVTLSSTYPVKIYVGKSKFTDELGIKTENLENDSFIVKSGEGWLALVGRDIPFYKQRNKQAAELLKLASDKKSKELWKQWYKLSGGNWGLPYSQLFRSESKYLKINSCDERGTYNAVVDFLRLQGMRWYMLSDLGKVGRQAKLGASYMVIHSTVSMEKTNEKSVSGKA